MFRFGSVEVDVRGRELLVGGTEAHLEPQAFDLLAYLIEHRDRVVPKTELLDEVWGDQFVSESALTTRIKEVRRAVGDDGRTQSVVKNVRGRGYRFVASIDDADVIDARRDAAASTLSVPTGRGAEIDQIERALDQGRVVSLVGPGGVGKTTLATAVGRRTDGAVLVDLTSVSDEAGVLPAWRQAAGLVGPVADEELSIETFAGSETLWILDNCEHVVARVAELLDLFCSVDGEGRILATTRERLGVSQELVIPIEPLTIEDARTVFLERANRVRPDFALAPDEVSDLDALLNDIDRLPLAIEMAAGRIGAMTIVDLNGAIGSSTSILRSAQRHPASRHRSITDLVAWSEGLLSSGERAIFSGCSVFAGPVELRDAVGVLAETDDQRAVVIEALSSLVDRSLIVADVSDAATRYRMLETTKGHVRASMDDAWSARHAVWFAEEADVARRQLQTDQERQAHDRLVALLPELRIAHAWARTNDVETAVRITRSLARWSYERLRGEPARWALELLGLLPEASSAWCDVAAAIAGDAANRADFDLARDHAIRALEAAGPLGRLASLDALTNVALYEGELDAVITWGDRLMEEAVTIGDVGAMVQATVSRSMVSTYSGDPASGRAEVVAFEPPPASPLDRGWLAYSLAESLAVVDPVAAQLEYRRAMELASDVGAELLLSVSRVSLAASLARDGDRDEAVGEFRSMFEAFQRTANLTHAITALRNLTVFLARMGRDRSAMELLGSLSGDEVKSTFGAEAEDLAACRSTVEERAGRAAVEAWIAVGRLWRPREAIQAALDALP